MGRASQVTDLGDGTVLRVGGDPEREAGLMELARSHGYPVPAIREVRPDALVLERIPGPTMWTDIRRRRWTLHRHVRTLADLHAQLHVIPHDGHSLLHLDLHPDNVLLSPAGPVVIDWTNARAGDPDTDVALTWLIAETSAGLTGRLAARLFRARVGESSVLRGLPRAAEFRLADSHVTDAERARVRRVALGP